MKLKEKFHHIKILFAQTTFRRLKKDWLGVAEIDWFKAVESVFYEIEDEFYLNKIIKKNQLMVDWCDVVVCYVDITKKRSGAKRALDYAKGNGIKIINLFHKQDDFWYGISDEEKNKQFADFLLNNRQK